MRYVIQRINVINFTEIKPGNLYVFKYTTFINVPLYLPTSFLIIKKKIE